MTAATNTGELSEIDQDPTDEDAATSTPAREAAEAEGTGGVRYTVEPNGVTPVNHTVHRIQHDDPRLSSGLGDLHPGTI